MKPYEAKFIVESGTRIGKRNYKFDVPYDLKVLNKFDKDRQIIGIGRWLQQPNELYIAVSKGGVIVYLNKKTWLEIAKDLKKLRNKI